MIYLNFSQSFPKLSFIKDEKKERKKLKNTKKRRKIGKHTKKIEIEGY